MSSGAMRAGTWTYLSERARNNYLRARAMSGRELSSPAVETEHWH